VVDTKQTKTIGEHHVAAELARHGWAPAMTRDGIERTDILAVLTTDAGRRTVEIQVKATRGSNFDRMSWRLGLKAQDPVSAEHEFFVLVAIPEDVSLAPRCFVVPRIHVSAAAWIGHQHWLNDATIAPGKRNTGIEQARQGTLTFRHYESRWDLLEHDQSEAPILLPAEFRAWAQVDSVGLMSGHPWERHLPEWPTS
jgi:hypothetical protein